MDQARSSIRVRAFLIYTFILFVVSQSEIDLMTEEEWDNYDRSQENADAIIDMGI